MADISASLSALGNAYNSAMARGDTGAAQQAHDQANALRQSNGQATYYDSNTDPAPSAQSQSAVSTSNPGTGTTGTTSGGLASQMLQAAQSPNYSGQTTTWNNGSGSTLKTPVYNGRSISSMSNLASSLGVKYTKDPSTGAITVNGKAVNPVGYDQSGNPIVQVRQVLNAMGVPDEQIQYDAKTGNVSYTAPQGQTQQPNTYTVPYAQPYQMQSLNLGGMPSMPQLQPYQAPSVASYYQNLMPMQQSFTPDWNTYYNQAHQQFDPTTNSDIQSLMTKMNGDIRAGDEKLNQRGIFNSGIAQANENDIRAKSSDAISKVLATSQSNIAKVAQQLYTDAFDQYYKGNTMAIQNNQMWLNQAMNQEKQAYTEWLGQQNLSLDQYKAALTAWNDAATQGLKQAQMSMDNSQFYDKLNQTTASDNASNALKMYQFNNLSADQSANLAQKQYEFNNQSANQKVTSQLDMFKMLGYVQMPDGSVKPTEQTTKDQQDTAIKLAQTLGYYTTPDGKIVPTQQATYQNGMLQLDNNKLTAQIHQWAADNQLKSAQIGLDQQKLDEKSQYDQAMIDKASASAQDTAKRTQLEGLKAQMISVTDQMKAYQAAGNTPPQSLVDQYNNIMNSVDKVSGASSNDTSSLDAGFPLQGTPSGSFSNFSNNGGGGDPKSVIQQVASKYGMDPKILYTIAQKESGMNPNVSPNENGNGTTDYGMMQINTGDAQDNGWDVNRLQSDLGYNVEAAAKTLVEKAKMLQRIGQPVNLFNLFKAYNGWSAQGARYAQDAVNIYNSMS